MTTLGIDIGGTSIKVAMMRDGVELWTRRSAVYRKPDRTTLLARLREVIGADAAGLDAVGLCVPGLLDRAQRVTTQAINVPGLNGESLDQFLADGLGRAVPAVLMTDAQAAACDVYLGRRMTGRLLLLALGTGVGAAVWDEAGPLRVDGESSGHFGQMDVSVEGEPVVGPDGGSGSLEGYIGAAALRERYGEEFVERLGTLPMDAAPIRALVRAIRIGHAMYRPERVWLVGGVGLGLRPILAGIRESVGQKLTGIARAGWVLGCGEDGYHAARGAARWAGF